MGSWLKLSNSIHIHTVTQTFTHAKQETFCYWKEVGRAGRVVDTDDNINYARCRSGIS